MSGVLPPQLQAKIGHRDIIVFDGECVFCSSFFKLMVRIDRDETFHFVVAQSELGTALYEALDLPTDDFETNLVIVDGVIYQRLDAFAAAMRRAGGLWRLLSWCRHIPEPLKSFLYHRIARNRYSIFGRYNVCMVPDARLKARFLDDRGVVTA